MKRPVFTEPRDYMALLVRRKWWVILCYLFTFPAAVLIVLAMPDVYVSETTILVEPKDVQGLAEKISALLQDQNKRKKFGIEAKKIYAEKFTSISMMSQLENLYDQYAARKLG